MLSLLNEKIRRSSVSSSSEPKGNLGSVREAVHVNVKMCLYRKVFGLVNSNLYFLSSSLVFIGYLNSSVAYYVDFF